MEYIIAFISGGLLCVIAQILIDTTKLTPARILVSYVVAGVFLSLFGIYDKFVEFAGAGATVPLSGFGYCLYNGTVKAINQLGFLGIFTGGLSATAGGIAAVVFFGLIAAIICKPKEKK